jgi:hypothetical protein
MCFPSPLSFRRPRPSIVWNTLRGTRLDGRPLFGRPKRPSDPAPTVVFDLPGGAGRSGTFFLQGLIEDPGARAHGLSVTNGIVIRAE